MRMKWIVAMLFLCLLVVGQERIYQVGFREGVAYLEDGREELLDVYYPADARPDERFPAVVIIHGGGWVSGVRNADREINIGSNLARMGYVSVSIDYLLSKKGKKVYPTNIQDCKKAVQWLRVNAEKLQVNPAKIGCIGGSAGGHMSALLAVAGADVGLEPAGPYAGVDSSIQAGVNLYGIMDFFKWRQTKQDGTPIEGKYRLGAQRAVMGSGETEDRENWLKMSPLHQVDKNDPPILQIHGRADNVVDYTQAINMKEKLDAAGVPNEMILLDGFGHTFSLQRWGRKALPPMVRQRVLAFYDKYLKGLSDEQIARRFALLEAFEAKNPDKKHYGGMSMWGGSVKAYDGKTITLVRRDKKVVTYRCSESMEVELDIRMKDGELIEGRRVEAQGKTLENKEFHCRKVIYRNDVLDAVGKVSAHGILRKRNGQWVVDCGKRVGVYLLQMDQPKVVVVERRPATLDDVKVGLAVVGVNGYDFGDWIQVKKLTLDEKR